MDTLTSGIKCASSSVISLPSVNCKRFSVVPKEGDAEFVTIYNVAKSRRRVVSCQSKLCQAFAGANRNIKFLGRGLLCPHLEVFREYFHIIEGIDPTDNCSEEEDAEPDFNDDYLPSEKVSHLIYIFHIHKLHFCVFNL